jgi:hypothetical protein
LQKKCPIYFPAIDQVKVISLSCAKNTSASFSAVVKEVHDFFYLCKKLANYLPVSKKVSDCLEQKIFPQRNGSWSTQWGSKFNEYSGNKKETSETFHEKILIFFLKVF